MFTSNCHREDCSFKSVFELTVPDAVLKAAQDLSSRRSIFVPNFDAIEVIKAGVCNQYIGESCSSCGKFVFKNSLV